MSALTSSALRLAVYLCVCVCVSCLWLLLMC
jgi:hypothetical protein